MKNKYPVHTMVLRVVTNDCDIMPSFVFSYGPRLNTEAYIKCLEEVVPPWIKRVAAQRLYAWQQISVPYHTSRRTQCWLRKNFCDHVTSNNWSPNSLNCSPLDYYVSGTVEWETNKSRCHTKDELKVRISAAFTNSNKETIKKACRRFWSLKAMIGSSGDFFE